MRSSAVAELVKPSQTLLLMVTAYCSYLAAGGRSPLDLVVLTVSEVLAISGTTAANMYLERDIDALMPRTSRRPLPSGSISPGSAVALASSMFLVSVIISSMWSGALTLTILVGFLSDILVYTNIVKRMTPYSVVLGGIAGAMPALVKELMNDRSYAASLGEELTGNGRAEDFRRSPTRDAAREMFKMASPLIAVVFVLEALEGVLGIP